MNIALIFAGGSGTRMSNAAKPKQFLQLHSKEIIVYTLEHFNAHREIDAIVVVCIENWIDHLRSLLKKYNLTKVKWIVPGGTTGQMSIRNGLKVLERDCPGDSLVLVHDGVRPLIDAELISANIVCAKACGSAVSVSPAIETIVTMTDDGRLDQIIERKRCFLAKAPQTFRLESLLSAHEKAMSEGLVDMIDSASLMKYYGHEIHTVPCLSRNIKITTPDDYYTFRALFESRENMQIFGM